MENKRLILNNETIKNKIYIIRNQQVMFDFDLAEIYGYSTKDLNRQVKNNLSKFEGTDFMFQITRKELDSLVRCKISTSPNNTIFKGQKGGVRYLPYAFTEQGIYMLMTVLKGDLAIKQSRTLIRLFKSMKEYIINNQPLITHDEALKLALDNRKDIRKIESIMPRMASKDDINCIQNQLDVLNTNFINDDKVKSFIIESNTKFEADIFFKEIFSKANKSLILIDNYISNRTLKLLTYCKSGIEIKIITNCNSNNKDKITKLEYLDFTSEHKEYTYSLINSNNKVHDRFISTQAENQLIFSRLDECREN